MVAAQNGNVGVVNTLIEAGCCIAKTTTNGDAATALDFAADGGHAACVDALQRAAVASAI
jgi:hypothetical protein